MKRREEKRREEKNILFSTKNQKDIHNNMILQNADFLL